MTQQESERTYTSIGHEDYHPGLVNAVARALGRLELVEEWAGVDHDMPGTTQEEREVSRWAAKQLLDELQKELIAVNSFNKYTNPPELKTQGGGRGVSELTAGPFKALSQTVPQVEKDERWTNGRARLHMTSDARIEQLKTQAYQTPLWEPEEVLSDHELEVFLRGTDAMVNGGGA